MRCLVRSLLFVVSLGTASAYSADVQFVRDIAPIFSQHCVKCHGPEKRQGGMRMDTKKFALEGGDLGALWVPGNSARSKIIELLSTDDSDERMPKKAPPLKPEEIALIKKWIDAGAVWPDDAVVASGAKKIELWSLKAPVRPAAPALKQKDWASNPIDAFTLAKMEAHGLSPAPQADRTTLLRRLSLDLIGLLPTPEEAEEFVRDSSPDAYEKAVDRLLASPHFGERWGRHWLDAARYADSNGFEKDRDRTIWPYRDWVIHALNADMPFDRFTIEQNAGDLLPNPTPQQIVATGFHRNTMINEEGGIDVEEFRYESVVDRVKTVSTTWLGLTVACAQCHTHKYDPITHKEYWQFYAFFNNCDEPDFGIPDPAVEQRRDAALKQIAQLEAALLNELPTAKAPIAWRLASPIQASAASGTLLSVQNDVVLAADAGPAPEKDTYDLVFDAQGRDLAALKLEVLTDPTLPRNGPGRAKNGNFVLSELTVSYIDADGKSQSLAFARAEAEVSQKDFNVAAAIDSNPSSGWAIDDGSGKMNKDRAATFTFAPGQKLPERLKLKVRLNQIYGAQHTLGKFRLALGYVSAPPKSGETPEQLVQRKQGEWEASLLPRAKKWTVLEPRKAVSRKLATMTVLPDKSVLVSGDFPNNDVYDVEFEPAQQNITALRLEVLPHKSLPDGGPGRAVMFSRGNFLLTELEAKLGTAALKFQNASQSASEKQDRAAAKAIDGVIDTGWSVPPSFGEEAHAVFEFTEALNPQAGARLALALHQFYIHQQTIGRFRVSVTSDPLPVASSGLPADVEEILLIPAAQRGTQQAARIRAHYLSVAPELVEQNKKIRQLRKSLPKFQPTMVLSERAPEHARKTHIHHRGEFLSLRAEVQPGVPEVLPPLPPGAPANRLGFAQWLVDRRNPLTARVMMNRAWYHLFGRGITQTLDDFGVQGEKPNNPELLDWLAVEFMEPTPGLRQGVGAQTPWSLKAMLRLIVTSATYRQSSVVRPDLAAKDPANEWLARFPRVRVEAEILRDIGLSASGLLSPKIGGPSIFPPQPDSVTAVAYGGYKWKPSSGESRYRRGLYVYHKRTAPFAAFQTFDAPNADECCVKRNRGNTPLGALALLNDEMFLEFARALAQRACREVPDGTVEARVRRIFRLVLLRQPDATEQDLLGAYFRQQLAHFKAGADAKAVAGVLLPNMDAGEQAAWTMVARTVLNLDEAVMRE